MAKAIAITKQITTLIETIKQKIIAGKKNIEKVIETEKTKTYWNIGKHISEHLLKYEDRAGYGDKLFIILEKELNIGVSILYRTVQFYETYSENFIMLQKLGWSHYLVLLTVKDEDKRKEYEEKVISQQFH